MQAVSQSRQPVQSCSSTKRADRCTVTWKPCSASPRTLSTTDWVSTVTLGWWAVAAIFGVEMQLAQSRVGKTLLSRIILPPIDGSFSTRSTRWPMSPSFTAASMPPIPLPMTSAS